MQCGPCKTCKHWAQDDDLYTPMNSLGIGYCKAAPMLFDSTIWSKEGDGLVLKDEFAKTTAFAQDGSDYSAYLYTLPDHGCTMHESKEC